MSMLTTMQSQPENDYSSHTLHTYKYGHSLSMKGHSEVVEDVLRPRSAFVLPCRGPLYPALPPDSSEVVVRETISRRVAHRGLMLNNNGMGVFRKTAEKESTSDYFYQKHLIRDFLNTMHVPEKKTLSRRPMTTPMPDRDHAHKDFIDTRNPVKDRNQTGYNRGHIRSILQLEAFGPQQSDAVREERSRGSLPQSPNTDRNRLISDTRLAETRSRGSTSPDNTITTSAMGTLGPDLDYYMGGIDKREKRRSAKGGRSRKVRMEDRSGDPGQSGTLKSEYRDALTELNPISRGRTWYKSFQYNKKMTKTDKEELRKFRAERERVRKEARDTASKIDEFDRKVASSQKKSI